MIKWLQIIIGALWFPHSLLRNDRLGYDFFLYYRHAKYGTKFGWLYAEWVTYIFKPFTLLPIEWAFTLWYGLLIYCWIVLIEKVPTWRLLIFALSCYPMLLILEVGQVTPILAVLCLTPLGSLLALLWKPYCGVFCLIHVYRTWRKHHNAIPKSESTAFNSTNNPI